MTTRIKNIHYFLFKKCRRLLWNDPKKIFLYPIIKKVWPYTFIGYTNLCQVYDVIGELERGNIKGSIVEMGCWKGGCGAFMALSVKKHGGQRDVWLFDSFEGLPGFTKEDAAKAKIKDVSIVEKKDILKSSPGVFKAEINDAQEIANKLKVKVNVIKGWFQNTLPQAKKDIGKIALLRLDADLYESTKYCLEELYDSVSEGGIIIVDDYGSWKGCNKALHEFLAEKNINNCLLYYPYGGNAYFRK